MSPGSIARSHTVLALSASSSGTIIAISRHSMKQAAGSKYLGSPGRHNTESAAH